MAVAGAVAFLAMGAGAAFAEHGEDPPPDPTDECHQTSSYNPFTTDRGIPIGEGTVLYADTNATVGVGYPVDAYAGLTGPQGYIEAEAGSGGGIPSPHARVDGEEQGTLVAGEGLEGYADTEEGACGRSDYFGPVDYP